MSDSTVGSGGTSGDSSTTEPRDAKPPRDKDLGIKDVRASDIEPYTGLRYLSKLFRFMSVILVFLLAAEIVTGIYTQGSASIPTLLGEASRLVVLAGVLWGTGDLANLVIDVGHDVRAARILASRLSYAKGISLPRTGGEVSVTEREVTARRNMADRVDTSDEGQGPPIP